jgi:hypothetical protein
MFKICVSALVIIGMMIGMSSCSNDFELTEEASDIPVVYGMLSSADTATYIRVEKAFIDNKTSALTLAKDISKLYFNDISVRIQQLSGGKEFTLQRVDGNSEGYKRSQGAFADAPNYLYKIRKSELTLQPGQQYKLKIVQNDGTLMSEAITTVINPLKNEDVTSPNPSALLSFQNNNDFRVRWFGDNSAVIHNVKFTFFIKEEKDGKISDKSVVWDIATNTEKTDLTFNGKSFYEFMQGSITDKSPAIKRYFQNASISIISGGKELKDYVAIGQANLGITSSGEIPRYTNLSNGALGIFSSTTNFTRNNIGLTASTLDSLRRGQITKSLNFQ